jgi:hypothetical protein
MLQEWLWCGCACGGGTGTAAIAADGAVVAAGLLKLTMPAQPPAGRFQLQAIRPSPLPPAPPAWSAGDFWVLFDGYEQPTAAGPFAYVVSVTPIVGPPLNPRLEIAAFDAEGIRLRLKNNTTPVTPADLEFMIEVKKYAK